MATAKKAVNSRAAATGATDTDSATDADTGAGADREAWFINGLSKGLAVIQAFNDEARALTLAEAATRTGLTRAAARRILMTLEDLGFAARLGERHFVLTPKVLSLGYAYLSSMPLWTFAEPVLESLVEELGETCSISALDGTELVYVLRIPVHRILSQGVTIGSRMPLHCHSAGRILLSGLTPTQLQHYFASAKLKPYTTRTITEPDKLVKAIEETRRKGYAWAQGELEDHISGLSLPIYQPDGLIIAALNVSVNRPSITEQSAVRTLLPKLRRAAERLNYSLAAGRNGTRVVRMGQVTPGRKDSR